PAIGLGDCGKDRFSGVSARGARDRAVDQTHCVVDENARWRAGRKPYYSAARRIGGGSGDVRQLHCPRVREESVSIDAPEHDRIVWEGARERLMGRKFFHGPAVLAPSPALDPFARPYILCPRFDSSDHFIVRGRSGEINPLQHIPQPQQVGMGVSNSRNDGGAMKVDYLRGWTSECLRLAIGSDEENSRAANRESGSFGSSIVHRINPPIGENEIGGCLRSEQGWCERDNGKVG